MFDTTFYNNAINTKRLYQTTSDRDISEEFTSDKSRIVFSSPFRRLQSKAQVFSLETNAAVRSRLTHTLEVATIGISIAEKIATKLCSLGLLEEKLILPFIKIVENACLLHDIGNPPFGHFAEDAIKKWFAKYWPETFKTATNLQDLNSTSLPNINELIKDFLLFDGNPQGLRIVTKLQDFPNVFSSGNFGLNLTYSQIMSIVKYPTSPSEVSTENHLKKKPGYFFSEKEKVDQIKKELNITSRYPLTYIMEAADDISYCLSDIEDGIEKKVITSRYFFEKLNEECLKLFPNEIHPYVQNIKDKKSKEDFFTFKIEAIRSFEKHAIDRYLDEHESVVNGTLRELIDKESDDGKLLTCLKNLSRKYLFRSREAENKELAGYHAIFKLLKKFKELLDLEHQKFNTLLTAKEDLNKVLGSGLDYQWRLFNMLPEKYVEAYKVEYNKCKTLYADDEDRLKQFEWFHRAHLIVDYISGMTDNYVLETYNILYGIKL